MSEITSAIVAFGITRLAREMRLPVQTVASWKARGSLPAERAIEFERITGVSRHTTRPDVFGPASPAPAEAAQ